MIYVVGDSSKKFLPLDSIRTKFLVDQKHEGDNIDGMNPTFCELTGLYYMWKHDRDEIVGLEHYRRYLSLDGKTPIREFEIRKQLERGDLLCSTVNYGRSSIGSFFMKMRMADWLFKLFAFLEVTEGKEYAEFCHSYIDGNRHVLGNIFIARRELLDEYAQYLFKNLVNFQQAELVNRRNIKKRIMGYLAEFLFGAWLEWNHKKQVETGICWSR